jgi:hypothetical protein
MPSPRTLLRLAGAAVVGLAATAFFAAPASAWDAKIEGNPVCDSATGTVTVKWSLKNAEAQDATFQVKAFGPDGSVIDHETGTLKGGGWTQDAIVQTKVKADTEATIDVKIVWKDGDRVLDHKTVHGEADRTACASPSPSTPESASPSASPSRSGGSGGGGSSPTASSSGAPSLPVTGPNAVIYGGGAAGLLAVGATLFVVARRRRIRFEA